MRESWDVDRLYPWDLSRRQRLVLVYVVGIARDGTIHTDGRTTIEAGDEVFVAGGDDAIQKFEQTVDNP